MLRSDTREDGRAQNLSVEKAISRGSYSIYSSYSILTSVISPHSHSTGFGLYFLGRRPVGREASASTVAMPAPEVAFYSDAHYIIFGETPVSDGESNYLYEVSGSAPHHDL